MSNCLFLYPNLSDQRVGAIPGATLTGPEWALPLSRMQERSLSHVARSRSAAPADTQFDVEFESFGEVRGVVLVNHNMTTTALWRITAWDDEGSYFNPVYQAELDVYPTLGYPENTLFEQDNWFDQKPLARDLQGFTQNAIHVLPAPCYARHWRIEIVDPSNPKGYVQVGRLWMATGWQPSRNPTYGAGLRFEDPTTFETSLSGAEYPDARRSFRVFNIAFPFLPDQEALDRGLELTRRAGTKGELFYIHRPTDLLNITRLSFLARQRTLSPWEQVAAFGRAASISFELKELL